MNRPIVQSTRQVFQDMEDGDRAKLLAMHPETVQDLLKTYEQRVAEALIKIRGERLEKQAAENAQRQYAAYIQRGIDSVQPPPTEPQTVPEAKAPSVAPADVQMVEKRFDAEALASLLCGSMLEEDGTYRFHRDGEAEGIYLCDLNEIRPFCSATELRAMTGGLVSGLVRHSKPLLALPCTLNELLAFEDKACVFRERLEAGDEIDDLIREISETNPDSGVLARALMFGEIPGDDVILTTTPAPMVTKGAIKAQPRARRDLLTPAIEAAQKGLNDIFDTPAVWTAMTEMAQARKNRLLGVTEDGIQWTDDKEEMRYFNKRNLGDRLRRMKKKLS